MMLKKLLLLIILLTVCLTGCENTIMPEKAVQDFEDSVSFDEETGILCFTIPSGLSSKYSFYIHISGRVKMGDGAMSIHLFEDESENNSWESGKTYSHEFGNDELIEASIVAGIQEQGKSEVLYETQIDIKSEPDEIITDSISHPIENADPSFKFSDPNNTVVEQQTEKQNSNIPIPDASAPLGSAENPMTFDMTDTADFVKDEAYNLYSKIDSCSIENDVMTVVFSAYAENPVNVEVQMDAWMSDDNSAGQVNETFSIDKLKEYSISMSSSWFDENHTKGTTYMVNVYISTPTYTTTTHRFHFRDGKISQAASSSEKKSENPPQIAITIDGQAIEYTTGLNEWNGAICDREDTLQYILSERSGIVVPYIKLGGTIEIMFKDNPPATVKLYDDVIDENGNNRFSSKETVNIPVELKDGKLSFKFTAHPASMLSSNSNDYENGNTYRGFKLRCKWDNGNDCEYGFVIRTDYK